MDERGQVFTSPRGIDERSSFWHPARLFSLLILAALFFSPALLPGSLAAQPLSDPGLGLGGSIRYSIPTAESSGTFFGQFSGRGRITGGLGVEASLAIRQASYGPANARDLDILEASLTVSALVFLLENSRVQPHPILGGGYHLVRNSGAVSGTEHVFAFHAGLGLEYRLKPRTTLIADGRYVFLEAESVQSITGRKAGYLSVGAGLLIHLR
ncbi:MAG: porin family protein [Thermoanaerobaculia bacterium]|nr:porin family protein [Thermoanaerobaculia bacterium]